MNIERYKWPVIVAASLHGALLLSTPHIPHVPRAIPVKPAPGPTPPPIPLDMREPENTSAAGEAGGAVNPLPKQADVPMPEDLHDLFRVALIDRAMPDKPVTDLKMPAVDSGEPGIGPGKFGPLNITPAGNLDQAPRAMAQPSPDYPYGMRTAGITGSVTIEFVVGIDGRVMSAEAVRWTHREFAEPAVRAVLRWKFEPGTVDGRKVRFRMAVPIEFNANS